jgi:hypothetical protein
MISSTVACVLGPSMLHRNNDFDQEPEAWLAG